MEPHLKHSKAKVLISVDLFGDKVDAIIANTPVRKVIKISLLDFFPPLKKVIMGFVIKKVKRMVPELSTNHVTMADELKQGAAKRTVGSMDEKAYRVGKAIDDQVI